MKAAWFWALMAAGGLLAQGQTSLQTGPPAAAPAFDVASIKPDTSDDHGISLNIQQSGRFRGTGVSLRMIMEEAYEVKDAQIIGAPPWFASDRYVIDAKPDEATSAEMQKLNPQQRKDKLMLMLRALLEDRCQLTLHKETRDLPAYALVVGKSGPKFQPSPAQASDKMQGIHIRRGEMEANEIELRVLADVLSRQLERPVVDNTGLAGKYDFKLTWAPDEHAGQMFKGAGEPGNAAAPPAPEAAGPSIFTAVQEQLGLKLEARKSPMLVLVIDRIERPSAN
jgi:uncharacterized protein (TIGR03435 family)